jgi:hypothetical protein
VTADIIAAAASETEIENDECIATGGVSATCSSDGSCCAVSDTTKLW